MRLILVLIVFLCFVGLATMLLIGSGAPPAIVEPTATPEPADVEAPTPTPMPTIVPTAEAERQVLEETIEPPGVFSPYSLRLRVVDEGLHIRSQPRIPAPGERSNIIGKYPVGAVFLTAPNSEVEADGYLWHRHGLGWSAVAPATGSAKDSHVALVEPPSAKALPQYGSLFVAHPVDLDLVSWVQYFGDTVFARAHGHDHNYGYAQGYHGGLDFGIDEADAYVAHPVHAGTTGVVVRAAPNAVWLSTGDYLIKYLHLQDVPQNLENGVLVREHSFLGNISTTDFAADNLHLHLEVLYDDTYLVNPAELMPRIPWELFYTEGYAPGAVYQDPNYQPLIEIIN